MTELLNEKLEALRELCNHFEVRRLDLFGSAARGDFDPQKSDFDFLVLFRRDGKLHIADQYLGLLIALAVGRAIKELRMAGIDADPGDKISKVAASLGPRIKVDQPI
jgi:predicted nucleotidyltransferase